MSRRVLLWDLDGTLVHWTVRGIIPRVTWAHWRFLAPRLGWARAAWHSTAAYLEMVRHRGPGTLGDAYVAALGRRTGWTAAEVRQVEARFVARGLDHLRAAIRPTPGALACFERLRARGRYRMVAATNPTMPPAFNVARLRWAGFEPAAFEHVTGTDVCAHLKGGPEFYRDLLGDLAVAPEDCVVIGNDARKDLPAALAGIPVFLVDAGHLRTRGGPPGVPPDEVGTFRDLERWLEGPSA